MGRPQRNTSPMEYVMSFARLSSSYEQTGQNLRRGTGLALCVLRRPPRLEEPPQAASRAPQERSYLNAINNTAPHPEQRRGKAEARVEGRRAAMQVNFSGAADCYSPSPG